MRSNRMRHPLAVIATLAVAAVLAVPAGATGDACPVGHPNCCATNFRHPGPCNK
jgi:hypothetical protein